MLETSLIIIIKLQFIFNNKQVLSHLLCPAAKLIRFLVCTSIYNPLFPLV